MSVLNVAQGRAEIWEWSMQPGVRGPTACRAGAGWHSAGGPLVVLARVYAGLEMCSLSQMHG